MTKRKPKIFNPKKLIQVINSWKFPILDKKHGFRIYIEEKARSNQTRLEHIIKCGHDLKTRDLETVPNGINNYFSFKKDPVYKNTYNYYIKRKGEDRGFIKVSIQLDKTDKSYAWIKTIFITYKIK
jgi:hypothetical protein